MEIFSIARLLNLKVTSSDHCPIFLDPDQKIITFHHRSFRFENAWLFEPMCKLIVMDIWENSGDIEFDHKIALCAERLATWGKKITGRFGERLKACKWV